MHKEKLLETISLPCCLISTNNQYRCNANETQTIKGMIIMIENKYCQVCNKLISNINQNDFYSFIRIKYCDTCRQEVKRQQTLARVHALRERKKQIDIERNTQLELLKQENELLRQNIIRLKENII